MFVVHMIGWSDEYCFVCCSVYSAGQYAMQLCNGYLCTDTLYENEVVFAFYIPTTCSTCVCVLLCILIVNLNCFQLFAQEEVVHIIGGGIKLLFL